MAWHSIAARSDVCLPKTAAQRNYWLDATSSWSIRLPWEQNRRPRGEDGGTESSCRCLLSELWTNAVFETSVKDGEGVEVPFEATSFSRSFRSEWRRHGKRCANCACCWITIARNAPAQEDSEIDYFHDAINPRFTEERNNCTC